MRRFYFTDEHKDKKGNHVCRIYKIINNRLVCIDYCTYCIHSTRGAEAEVFHRLMEIGEIPKKYSKSSEKLGDWIGDGYFAGEVTKYYDIKQIY